MKRNMLRSQKRAYKLKVCRDEPFDISCTQIIEYEYPPGILGNSKQVIRADGSLDYFSSLDSISDWNGTSSCSVDKKLKPCSAKSKLRFSKHQIKVLIKEYGKNCSIESQDHAKKIAKLSNLQTNQVYKWFVNRRFRYKCD